MYNLKSVKKPTPGPFEALAAEAEGASLTTGGSSGSATGEASRSERFLVVKGKSGLIRPPSRPSLTRTNGCGFLTLNCTPGA